jgi:hypothetical protein
VVGVTLGPKVRHTAQHAQRQQQGLLPQPQHSSFACSKCCSWAWSTSIEVQQLHRSISRRGSSCRRA